MNEELVSNRKAFHEYEILETFEAGIALVGTEVKALKGHHGNLQDAFVSAVKNELILKNASISLYSFGNIHNHEEKRDRKLLLHKREIAEIEKACSEKGCTAIPLSLYLKKGKIKVKIAIAKGKKAHDKRASVKEREHKREMSRFIKGIE